MTHMSIGVSVIFFFLHIIANELKVDTNKSTPNSKEHSVNLNKKSYDGIINNRLR